MRFAGVLPPDAPDPREEIAERIRGLPFTVMGLVPQPALEDYGALGLMDGTDGHGRTQAEVSVGYTLWRNPDDRDDPANLAELDETTRASLAMELPWPRPQWLIDAAQRMRYPQLFEVVRTSWSATVHEDAALRARLVHHMNHILMNQFRAELGLQPGPTPDGPWKVRQSAVNPQATLEVDGITMPAMEIDTDPFVYGIGVQLPDGVVSTVAIPRAELPFVRLALAARAV